MMEEADCIVLGIACHIHQFAWAVQDGRRQQLQRQMREANALSSLRLFRIDAPAKDGRPFEHTADPPLLLVQLEPRHSHLLAQLLQRFDVALVDKGRDELGQPSGAFTTNLRLILSFPW